MMMMSGRWSVTGDDDGGEAECNDDGREMECDW